MCKCYMQDQCKKYKNGQCTNEECGLGVLISSSYNQSNIPKRYRKNIPLLPKDDKNAFLTLKDYQDNVLERVEQGEGLYIYSEECGNGKTTWATKIARQYIIENAFKQKHENLVYFTTVSDYLEELKQAFSTNTTAEVEARLKRCDLLILDDIGVEKTSEWVIERLYALINYRINEEKSTIITSNLNLEELSLKLDKRIASRIKGTSIFVEFTEQDKR